MKTIILFTIIVTVLGVPVEENPSQFADADYCYSDDTSRPQKLRFSTKTAYQYVKGTEYSTLASIPNCKATKFWLFSRHGTRLPEKTDIQNLGDLEKRREEILKNYEQNKVRTVEGGLCAKDLEMIQKWVLDKNITMQYEQFLVDQGWNDLKLLAKDYQTIYPDLLLKDYEAGKFMFRHTNIQRTEASYKAFVEGLFGDAAYNDIKLPDIPVKDTLLDPHDNCELFKKKGDNAKAPGSEIDKFQNSDLLKQMLDRVSKRLGYPETLDYEDVSLMYDMCRFEQSWFIEKPSAWCTAFRMEDIKIYEYFEDMKHQYKAGYVDDLNARVPCEIVQDMVKRLESDEEPFVTAYFSHSTLMHLTLVALDAFKDKDLILANNFDSMENRKWRTSIMVPFAANLAVIKYSCSDGTKENAAPTTKVRFFLNQKPLQLDWCKDGLCDLENVSTKLNFYAKADCPNEFCREPGNAGHLIQASIFVILVTISYNVFNLF